MARHENFAEELKDTIRDAALEVLGPALRQATMSAAKAGVSKGPELVSKHLLRPNEGSGLGGIVTSKAFEALSAGGGIGGLAGGLVSKLLRGGKGGGPTGYGRGRRMPVQQIIHLSVPLKQAYIGWTEYKQWSRFMHRANQVDPQIDEKQARVRVTEKMWGFTRPFTAEVVTQRPYERIKWNSTEGPKHAGVINFHELAPRLTLVEVNLDHWPSGPVEKVARGARFVKRAVRADFHRFQGWIEMKDDDELAALEGWRGTVEDGRIVKSHEEALEEEGREEEREPEAREETREEAPEPVEEQEAPTAEAEQPQAAEQEQAGGPPRAPQAPRARPSRTRGPEGRPPARRATRRPRSTGQ